ncbi:MAG: protein-(glutamine-N5) methyltransferase, release factor-specific, partial [Myxococcota bacterium]
RIALDGGEDGLDLYRRLIDQLDSVMEPGAAMVFEAGADQVPALAELLKEAGLTDVKTHADLAQNLRVASARAPSPG